MPYGESYGNTERSLAEAIADAVLARDTTATKIQEICDRLNKIIGLVVGAMGEDGGF